MHTKKDKKSNTDVIQLTLTLKMTTTQVVQTSITVNNNSPIQDYVHPNDQTQPTFEMTPGFKPFTKAIHKQYTSASGLSKSTESTCQLTQICRYLHSQKEHDVYQSKKTLFFISLATSFRNIYIFELNL